VLKAGFLSNHNVARVIGIGALARQNYQSHWPDRFQDKRTKNRRRGFFFSKCNRPGGMPLFLSAKLAIYIAAAGRIKAFFDMSVLVSVFYRNILSAQSRSPDSHKYEVEFVLSATQRAEIGMVAPVLFGDTMGGNEKTRRPSYVEVEDRAALFMGVAGDDASDSSARQAMVSGTG
jgi:hypothetical protein